ncbi:MAG: radical SAM protein [Proteobacteria bacterium]|nr:radical SAM protein [Pseudomonadota bacterium]
MTRTLLVAPPYQADISSAAQTTVGAPMGLAYLAAALRDAGESVSVLDANALRLTVPEAAERIVRAGNAGVVGLTATTPTIGRCAAVVEHARARGFAGIAMVGGAHPSALPAETLRAHPGLDVAVIGEAEGRIAEIVRRAHARESFAGIGGIAWRIGDAVECEPEPPAPPELDSLSGPARDLLPMDRYRSPDSRNAHTVVATRGCPAPCHYCAVPNLFGKTVRRREPAEVAEEVGVLVRRWGADHINFVDDTFTWDADWVIALCDAFVERGLHRRMSWQCLTRVDRVDGRVLGRMASAGCLRVEFGIECASTDGLTALRKGVRREQVQRAFDRAHRAGIQTMALAMVNVPGESVADVEETWRLVQALDPDQLQVSICTPYPGTGLYDEARAEGRLRTDDFARYRFLREAVLDNGVMTEAEALAAQRLLQRRFWLRPRTVGRLAKRSIRRPSLLWAAAQALPAFVRDGP